MDERSEGLQEDREEAEGKQEVPVSVDIANVLQRDPPYKPVEDVRIKIWPDAGGSKLLFLIFNIIS